MASANLVHLIVEIWNIHFVIIKLRNKFLVQLVWILIEILAIADDLLYVTTKYSPFSPK
ncbi:hypothetical protein SAMN04488121_102237 [Chitinophaga filiformis]|uniref:Uncharacterized protein n=1 Tax=Chitinophaga filiformis TaxID=104663 RepID=A0A1G7LZ12_CHIFI|nr:hypothetical protein SAMN04488121_102237 [Chitinophaga filiformis]